MKEILTHTLLNAFKHYYHTHTPLELVITGIMLWEAYAVISVVLYVIVASVISTWNG